ncbi:hypothetical protein Tco_0365615 [Tanacetum coccineum]
MFDELLTPPPSVDYPASKVVAPIHEVVAPVLDVSIGSPSSINIDQDAPSPSHSQTAPETQSPVIPNDVEEDNHDIEIAQLGNDPYFGILILEIPSDQSSSSKHIDIDFTYYQGDVAMGGVLRRRTRNNGQMKLMNRWCVLILISVGSWLHIQDIEDMLLLLVQGKLTNLTAEERLAFNVSLRMFTRSIVIQRRVEDLQLGVKSYQKKLNLTKSDTYRSDLKRREAYTAYSNPRGFIYQNKDKKNKLMRIDELHKFSDGTLNDVWNALNDRLKGIRMKYLPQTIWRQSDRYKAGAMIQAIDKQLKTRRIMRSLEKFVGGRPYEGDFRLLQRTI